MLPPKTIQVAICKIHPGTLKPHVGEKILRINKNSATTTISKKPKNE